MAIETALPRHAGLCAVSPRPVACTSRLSGAGDWVARARVAATLLLLLVVHYWCRLAQGSTIVNGRSLTKPTSRRRSSTPAVAATADVI